MGEKPTSQIIDLFEALKAALLEDSKQRKRAAARAEPLKPKVSLGDIEAAFERNKEGL